MRREGGFEDLHVALKLKRICRRRHIHGEVLREARVVECMVAVADE